MLDKPITYTEFLKMLMPLDADTHLYETACSQGIFFIKHISHKRTFVWWWNLSFSWQDTNQGFEYWKKRGYDYIEFYTCISRNTTENCFSHINHL